MNVIFPANPVLTPREHTRSYVLRHGGRRRGLFGTSGRRHDARHTPVD